MQRANWWPAGAIVVALMALAPAVTSGQGTDSAIAGLVRDSSGAVLPGVTVEASSPALIERTRTAVTDASGQYKIVDLRPGTYSVTFTLTGFATVKREGIELVANFTATVNADLRVGSLEETLTVTGQTPIVDVQTTQTREVLTRDLLDSVPTGRYFQGIGATVPAVSMGRFDVAGNQAMQQGVLVVYGGTGTDFAMSVDGQNVMGVLDKGWYPLVYHNDNEFQEMSYQTAGAPAEVQTGGVYINMISKEGGNQFRGSIPVLLSGKGLQASNLNSGLVQRGFKSVGTLHRIWDVDPALGGPIMKDRAWFFASYRNWSYENSIGNIFYRANPTQDDRNRSGTPGLDDNLVQAISDRLTFRLSDKDKLMLSWNRYPRIRQHSGIETGLVEPEASTILNIFQAWIGQGKWTRTVSDRLLLEGGGVYFVYKYSTPPSSDSAVVAATCNTTLVSCAQGTDWGTIGMKNLATGISYNGPATNTWNDLPKFGLTGTATYVTGSHAIKLGAAVNWGHVTTSVTSNGNMLENFLNGVPQTITAYSTPSISTVRVNADLGVFLQDSWTIKRLTLNPGIRFEYLHGSADAITLPAGRFAPARNFAEVPCLPCWKDISPRFGAAFDLAGNGRTAIKGSVGKYTQQEQTGFAATYAPAFLQSQSLRWTDLNGDGIAEDNELGASPVSNFGAAQTRFPDPAISRPFQMLYNAGLTQQLGGRMSVSLNYYHRDYYRIIATRNTLVPPSVFSSAYTPVTLANPLTGGALTIYNLNPALLGQTLLEDYNSPNDTRTFNDIDVTFNARLPNGATLLGGVSTGKLHAVSCDITSANVNAAANNYDPNALNGCDDNEPWRTSVKLTLSYPLPAGFRVSGVFQSLPGLIETRTANNNGDFPVNLVVTRSLVPNLTQPSLTVRLNQPGTQFLDRDNQVDLSVSRNFKMGRAQLKPQLDLFNVFNVAPVTNASGTYGPNLLQPITILPGRLLRFGARVDF